MTWDSREVKRSSERVTGPLGASGVFNRRRHEVLGEDSSAVDCRHLFFDARLAQHDLPFFGRCMLAINWDDVHHRNVFETWSRLDLFYTR